MKSFSFFLSLILLVTLSCGEQKSKEFYQEEILIKSTIDNYFEGWLTKDTSKIGMAMHATCQLKNIKEEDVVIYDRATYLGFFKPGPRRENSSGRIINIDVTGPIAAAKVEIETPKWFYTDYFNLMKLKEQWYIVDKISTSVAKE